MSRELAAQLQAAYDKVKEWPENSETGFMDLLSLRNLVPDAIAALSAPAPSIDAEAVAIPSSMQAALAALKSYEADYGEPLPDDYELGRIDESRHSASFRIRAGHIRQWASALSPDTAATDWPKVIQAAIDECKVLATEQTKSEHQQFYRGVAAAVDTLEIYFKRHGEAATSPMAGGGIPVIAPPPSPDTAARMEGREAIRKLITSAKMLQQNAEGCAINHYGEDFGLHGMPGWLADTKADIAAAEAALEREGRDNDLSR